MSYHNMITVYKVGTIPWETQFDQPGTFGRAYQGLQSLYAGGKWERRYYQGERLEDGAQPFFVFRALEDALDYWKWCECKQTLHEIWQAETSSLIELPTYLPVFSPQWDTFWQSWLFDQKELKLDEDEFMESPWGSWACPDILLIKRVYPEAEQEDS